STDAIASPTLLLGAVPDLCPLNAIPFYSRTMIRILSIDGGSIRGIIPDTTLVALEQQMGKPVRECFDFLAGTSTGALIAAAAAAGVPATRILGIYVERSREIFTPPQPLANAKRLYHGYMYDPGNIQKVIASELGLAASWVL